MACRKRMLPLAQKPIQHRYNFCVDFLLSIRYHMAVSRRQAAGTIIGSRPCRFPNDYPWRSSHLKVQKIGNECVVTERRFFNLHSPAIRIFFLTLSAVLIGINTQIFLNAGHLYPGGGVTLLLQRIARIFFHRSIP